MATFPAAPKPGKSAGKDVKIYGMPPSQNACGPVLLAMDAEVGGMQMCNLMEGEHQKPEFQAINPYMHIPAMKDGSLCIGESNAILRYLSMKYKPEYYPVGDPATCARIDFAMDAFGGEVYPKHTPIVYTVMGFTSAPADQKAANQAYKDALQKYASVFLQGKFVCGDKITIADFKIAPFFFSAVQPGITKAVGFEAPQRIERYCEDFNSAVKASVFMKAAGGFAIAEFIASKAA